MPPLMKVTPTLLSLMFWEKISLHNDKDEKRNSLYTTEIQSNDFNSKLFSMYDMFGTMLGREGTEERTSLCPHEIMGWLRVKQKSIP